MTADLERRFLLVKRGLYYAPDNHGYTGIKERAGRYLQSDASPDHGVTAIHEDEAPDYSPACFHDIAREHLQSKIARLRAENEALRGALAPFVVAFKDHFGDAPSDDEWLAGAKWLVPDDITLDDFRRARQALQEGSRHE